MEEQDLREIGITDPAHRRKILSAARSLPKVCVSLKCFAEDCYMLIITLCLYQYYFVRFPSF